MYAPVSVTFCYLYLPLNLLWKLNGTRLAQLCKKSISVINFRKNQLLKWLEMAFTGCILGVPTAKG